LGVGGRQQSDSGSQDISDEDTGSDSDQDEASQQRVDINTASPEMLETLSGIGPVLARRIIQCREEKGPFATIDDIIRVPGIGPVKLNKLRDRIKASSPEPQDTENQNTESKCNQDSDAEEKS
jgi:competence protein ComEA